MYLLGSTCTMMVIHHFITAVHSSISFFLCSAGSDLDRGPHHTLWNQRCTCYIGHNKRIILLIMHVIYNKLTIFIYM